MTKIKWFNSLSGSLFSSKVAVCGAFWRLCLPRLWINETLNIKKALIIVHLNAEVILVVTDTGLSHPHLMGPQHTKSTSLMTAWHQTTKEGRKKVLFDFLLHHYMHLLLKTTTKQIYLCLSQNLQWKDAPLLYHHMHFIVKTTTKQRKYIYACPRIDSEKTDFSAKPPTEKLPSLTKSKGQPECYKKQKQNLQKRSMEHNTLPLYLGLWKQVIHSWAISNSLLSHHTLWSFTHLVILNFGALNS